MTKRLLILFLPLLVVLAMYPGSKPTPRTAPERPTTVMDEDERYAILREEIVDTLNDDYTTILWVKNKETGTMEKLLQCVPSSESFLPDTVGKKFIPAPIDSLPPICTAHIRYDDPLTIIVEELTSMSRLCYYIDIPSRKAWYVPANLGYIGDAASGDMIFQSFGFAPTGGRFIYLQIFNDEGEMIDSISLEHADMEQYGEDALNNTGK